MVVCVDCNALVSGVRPNDPRRSAFALPVPLTEQSRCPRCNGYNLRTPLGAQETAAWAEQWKRERESEALWRA